jgi:hypothetical protein
MDFINCVVFLILSVPSIQGHDMKVGLLESEMTILSRINWHGINVLEISDSFSGGEHYQSNTKHYNVPTRISRFINGHFITKKYVNLYHSVTWNQVLEDEENTLMFSHFNNQRRRHHQNNVNKDNNNKNNSNMFLAELSFNYNNPVCHMYDVIIATNPTYTRNASNIMYVSKYLRRGGRAILNITLFINVSNNMDIIEDEHVRRQYHYMTDLNEIDRYILKQSQDTLQIVEYVDDKKGWSLSKIQDCRTILISAIKLDYLIRRRRRDETTTKGNKNHLSIIQQQRCTRPDRIMFVAHPDDELIFGWYGFLQIHPTCWHVVSVTNKNRPREHQFKHAMKILNIESFEVWGYMDCVECVPFSTTLNADQSKIHDASHFDNIANHIRRTILQIRPSYIVTHNPFGEYGHAQHVELSYILTNMVQHDKLYYFNPSIFVDNNISVNHDNNNNNNNNNDRVDSASDPFLILMQNIPSMRVIYPQEFGRTMAFDTTMSLPFVAAIDFKNNKNNLRHAMHLYCVHINALWDITEHSKFCYQARLIRDLVLDEAFQMQNKYTTEHLENIIVYHAGVFQSIAGSPNPTHLHQHVATLLNNITRYIDRRGVNIITSSTHLSSASPHFLTEFLERKRMEDVLKLQKFGKYTLYKMLYEKLENQYRPIYCDKCRNSNSNNKDVGVKNKCLIPMVRQGNTYYHTFTFRIWIVIVPKDDYTNQHDILGDSLKYLHHNIELFIANKGSTHRDVQPYGDDRYSIYSHYNVEHFNSYLGEKYLMILCNLNMNELVRKIHLYFKEFHFQFDKADNTVLPQLISIDMMLDKNGNVYPLQYNNVEDGGTAGQNGKLMEGMKATKKSILPNNKVNQLLFHDYFNLLFDAAQNKNKIKSMAMHHHNHFAII